MAKIDFADSETLCEHVAKLNDGTCILSFSCGKDSIAAWIQLKRYFHTVIPLYLWRVPGIKFVENSLDYYEQKFGTHIFRLPHPALYRWLRYAVFQAPQRRAYLEQAGNDWLVEYDYDDCFDVTRMVYELPDDSYCATGVRAMDNIIRRASIKKYGALNEKRCTFFPIFDWTKDRVIKEIRDAGIKLPVDYLWFGRSFDGLDYRFLGPLSQHAPQDYATILEWFPMAAFEVKRIEYRRKHLGEK